MDHGMLAEEMIGCCQGKVSRFAAVFGLTIGFFVPVEAFAKRSCLSALAELDAATRLHGPLVGVEVPVEVTGALGGVWYRSYLPRTLVLDCSLVVSLARAGRILREAGVTEIMFSSAYQRRNVRGTNRPSRHGRGLAIDLHELRGDSIGVLKVDDDFEQGLGDDVDCLGSPVTKAGTILRTIFCDLSRGGLFRLLLSPDSDPDHYNHFHIEALPWDERDDG